MDEQLELTYIELTPEHARGRRRQSGVFLGGLTLVAFLLIAAYLAAGSNDSEVDVAAPQDGTTVVDAQTEPADGNDVGGDGQTNNATKSSEPLAADAPPAQDLPTPTTVAPCCGGDHTQAAGSEYYGGESDAMIFDGEQFISVGYNQTGPTLRTSPDGIDWDEEPFPGLPTNASVYRLAEHDGTVVGLVEQWQELEESKNVIGRYLGPPVQQKQFLASTTDLVNWTYSEIPSVAETVHRNITGLALSESGIVMLVQHQPESESELALLFDAGVLDEDTIERYCGLDFEGGDIHVQLCTFDEDESLWLEFDEALNAAESDEARAAIEQQFDELFVEPVPEILATITPLDPLYDQLSLVYNVEANDPDNRVLSGPVTGPWVDSELPATGYPSGLTVVDGTYISLIQNWDESLEDGVQTTVLRSANGVDWVDAGSLPTGWVEQLVGAGENLVALGGVEDGAIAMFISSDLGDSWSRASLTTNLYGAYPQVTSGPAGIAVVVRGSTVPFPVYEAPEEILVSKDGYTLTINYSEQGGVVELTGPDGGVVYSLNEDEMYGESAQSIVRFGGFSGTQTFLDPDTGEDLVAFTRSDMEEAYAELEPEDLESQYVEGVDIQFSVDAMVWKSLDDPRLDIDLGRGNLQVAAIGNDEIIISVTTWTEPPSGLFAFEQEERNPTEAEEAALNEWFETRNGGQTTEYFSVPVG